MKRAFRLTQFRDAVSALILAAGLSMAVSASSAAEQSLYERLGGQTAIVAVVDIKTAHAGMGVQDMHFGALVGDLVKTLDKSKVPERRKRANFSPY